MLPELGHFALILALCVAVVQAIVPLVGAARNNIAWMQLARMGAMCQCLLIGFSFLTLAIAFLSNDFSVAYVAQNSNTQLPALYRFCAIWGAHEGSLLLWTFILSLWMAAVGRFSRDLPLPLLARVLAVLSMISIGFLLFILMTSDPFARLLPNFPVNGRDLNPLLQDPGLVSHPPMLYMGYVGFSVVFAFAIAALIGGRLDAAWAKWSRPWTTVAWVFLTLGIVLGSWWAYRELGWGGWWFWDPVENASLLPWLAGTALLHSLAVTEKRNTFKAWTVLLAIFTFSLSLLGTFLVRSGVLVSVHAFAVDPLRGLFMLRFLLIVVGGSLALYAWRAPKLKSASHFSLLSRETFLLINNILLTVAMLTILLGTLYPLMIDALNMGKISVGPPYFNAVFIPLMIPVMVLIGIGPMVHWKKMSWKRLFRRLPLTLIVTLALAFILPWLFTQQIKVAEIAVVGLSIWVFLTTAQELFYSRHQRQMSSSTGTQQKPKLLRLKKLSKSQIGMMIAHVGVGVCALGIVLSSIYSVERDVKMKPGDEVSVSGYQFKFLGATEMTGPNYTGALARVSISSHGKVFKILAPSLRVYNASQMAMPKTAIDAGPFRDLYVALAQPLEGGAWAMRIYDKPFIRWIWSGGFLMMLGGIVVLTDKRYRMKRKERAKT